MQRIACVSLARTVFERLSARCAGPSQTAASAVNGATTEPRIRINRPDDQNARCRVSRVRVQPNFSPPTQPPTTLSTYIPSRRPIKRSAMRRSSKICRTSFAKSLAMTPSRNRQIPGRRSTPEALWTLPFSFRLPEQSAIVNAVSGSSGECRLRGCHHANRLRQ